MCDTSPVRNWLLAALVALGLAVAAIAVAALLNASFWEAHKAPKAMLATAGFTGIAMAACGFAISSLNTVCACLDSQCRGQCASLLANISALELVLGIQVTAALAAVWPALIPLAGLKPMEVIAGALVVQGALLLSAIAFVAMLDDCARTAATTEPFPAVIVTGSAQSGLDASLSVRKGWFWRKLWKRRSK